MVGDTYRVLLISGDRTHQEGYAAAFDADPRAEIVGVADEADVSSQRHEWNRAMAKRYTVPYYDNLDEALAQRDVDLISVCPEIERRGRVLLRCAGRGLPLFLDKPLAGTQEDLSDIQAAINGARIPAQMYSFTSAPWARAAKTSLASGELGDLIAVHAEVMFAKGRAGTARTGVVRNEHEFPGRFTFTEAKRELFDLGIYPIVLCLWLADSPVKQVTALTANYFFAEHAAADIEDFGALTIEFENGVVGSAVGGRIGYHSHPKIGPHGVTVSGTGGTKTFSAWDPHIEVFSNRDPSSRLHTRKTRCPCGARHRSSPAFPGRWAGSPSTTSQGGAPPRCHRSWTAWTLIGTRMSGWYSLRRPPKWSSLLTSQPRAGSRSSYDKADD